MGIADRAKELLVPVVENAGYEVVDIKYYRKYGENNLTIFIFKKGGVTLEDCEKVSAAAGAVLDENDITDGLSYNLNVSSPGLDRPITSLDDYRRALDTEIEIDLFEPVGDRYKINGILVDYDGDKIYLDADGGKLTIATSNIKKALPCINFK